MELLKAVGSLTILAHLHTQIDTALLAHDNRPHLAALLLALAANLGGNSGEVVDAVIPDVGLHLGCRHGVPVGGRGENDRILIQHNWDLHGGLHHIPVHEGEGHVQLELVQGQAGRLLVENEGVDQGQVNEVVEHPPVPLLGFGLQPEIKLN